MHFMVKDPFVRFMAEVSISRVALITLDERRLNPLQDAVQRILSTQRAEYIFAQVADGVPTNATAEFKSYGRLPVIEDRTEPSVEALELIRNWRSNFHLTSLDIDSDVLQAYQNSRLGTREFKLRLIEITAIVIHTIAALLFNHTHKPPYKCPPPKKQIIIVDGWPEKTGELIPSPFPTYLFHDNYLDHDMYPMGVADLVGFWVETYLFGGVVIFDHGKSDREFRDVYLHPDSRFKVFKLSDTQIDQWISFGLYGEPTVPSLFPIKAERKAVRLFQEFTMQQNIYRSKNDRKVPEIPAGWHPLGRVEDDPHMMEIIEKYNKGELKYGSNEV